MKFLYAMIVFLISLNCLGELTRAEQETYNLGNLFFQINPKIKLKFTNELSVREKEEDSFYLRTLPNSFTAQEVYEMNRVFADKPSYLMDKLNLVRTDYPKLMRLMYEIERQLYYPIFYLKELTHRPRPCQVLVNLPLPMKRPDYGSYPSGTVLEAFIEAEILGDIFTSAIKKELWNLAEEIGKQRVKAGINFPSDYEYSKQLVRAMKEALLNKFEIKRFFEEAKEEVKKKNPKISMKEKIEIKEQKEVILSVKEMSLEEFARKMEGLTHKKIKVLVNKPVTVTASFPLKEWQLRLEEIAEEKDLEIKQSKTETLIIEKICTRK